MFFLLRCYEPPLTNARQEHVRGCIGLSWGFLSFSLA